MSEAAKSVHPNVKILGPSFCVIKVEELRQLAKLDFFQAIDVLSIHAYVRSTPPEQEFIQKVRELKSYLASAGKKDLPIFITEYGWPIPPGDWQTPVDPLTQAQYCSRSLILLTAEEIDCIQWFCMYWGDPSAGPYGYGLLNWDLTPRPSFPAFANAARCLTGTSGPGKTCMLTPTTYVTLFRKGTKTLAVVWSTQGETDVVIPKPWNEARDMMGRLIVTKNVHGKITVGPSPVFIELPGSALYDLKVVDQINIRQGGMLALLWKPIWTPKGFFCRGVKCRIAGNVPPGSYLVLGRSGNQWEAVQVDVGVPLAIHDADVRWPVEESEPMLQTTLRNELDTPVTLTGSVLLNDTVSSEPVSFTIEPHANMDVTLPLPPNTPGKRYRGEVIFEETNRENAIRTSAPLDLTILPCFPVKDRRNLSNLPIMDISSWEPYTGTLDPLEFDPADCSATLQAGYDEDGLILYIRVRDSVHSQTQISRMMWMEDSLQLGFDLDCGQPWLPNQGGYNGHFRVFEYGVALGETSPMTWRWISYLDSLPRDTQEPRIQTDITRKDDAMVYHLVFPWPVLGLDKKPTPGSMIGFALVVNDFDASPSGRKGLRLFNGIVEQKAPSLYGRLWVR